MVPGGLVIVSGGQTGVDRAALDAALAHGITCAGWCPEGRLAEDGEIPDRYPLTELEGAGYPERTRQNVYDTDATVVLTEGLASEGAMLTVTSCQQAGCPFLVLNIAVMGSGIAADKMLKFIQEKGVQVLNVAGPRESESPGIAGRAQQTMELFLEKFLGLTPAG